MPPTDAESILTIAMLAAVADGAASPDELARLKQAVTRLGVTSLESVAGQVAAGRLTVAEVAARLSDVDARRLAYETALLVCHADGAADPRETAFLVELRTALGLAPAAVQAVEQEVSVAATTSVATAGPPAAAAELDQLILQQAMISGALELLPDRLANMVIIPLQLRLVYRIGQAHGQQLDSKQVRDLAGTLGIGAASQVLESVVRGVLGGIGKGLLGGLLGGATGVAAGSAVSFASTYALGHAAERYYAQGRHLSAADLRALFARFQEEARALFPKVQDQIQAQSTSLNLQQLLTSLSGR
ncbi:MAG: DUF533 domain-containing protein [Gemmatimonadota bacterium]|nr:DUF533 domain-containing protein [Gemmatimonadota bacterium]